MEYLSYYPLLVFINIVAILVANIYAAKVDRVTYKASLKNFIDLFCSKQFIFFGLILVFFPLACIPFAGIVISDYFKGR